MANKTLQVLRRLIALEAAKPSKGSIERCAKLYSEINRIRAGLKPRPLSTPTRKAP